jgi:hypothetical protein
MKPLRIGYCGFWATWEADKSTLWTKVVQPAAAAIGRRAVLQPHLEDAEVVLHSLPGVSTPNGLMYAMPREARAFRGPRICYSGENLRGPGDLLDNPRQFLMACMRIDAPNYARLPNYLDAAMRRTRPLPVTPALMCSFLASNTTLGEGVQFRQRLFLCMLEDFGRERTVYSGGAACNNLGSVVSRRHTGAWLRHFRWNIAAENSYEPGYVTEKLVQAKIAGSVPIYMGAPDFHLDVNPKAVVNVRDFGGSINAVLAAVRHIDDDPRAYAAMRAEPLFAKGQARPSRQWADASRQLARWMGSL